MENNSYLPTYTEAVQLDPTKLETKNNGDPVKFIPENAYSRTETTVIHVIQPTQFGPDRDFCHQTVLFQNSQEIFCIKCREVHRTKTLRANHSSFSWMLCFFMFLFGCWPCCAIPFCIGSLKDIDHYCSNCNAYIGTYHAGC